MNGKLVVVLAMAISSGCVGTPEGVVSSASTESFIGHFVNVGQLDSEIWIDEVNLHADGTFEANMGNGASNFSGHVFAADGTYEVDGSTLTLTYDGGNDVYTYNATGSTYTLSHVGDAVTDSSFELEAVAKPITLDFAAGSSPHDVSLTAGQTIVIWYDARRDSCPATTSTTSPVTAIAAMDDLFGAQHVQALPHSPVNGAYRGLFSVPSGKTMAMWFELVTTDGAGNVSCNHWDSNYQNNYDFTVN